MGLRYFNISQQYGKFLEMQLFTNREEVSSAIWESNQNSTMIELYWKKPWNQSEIITLDERLLAARFNIKTPDIGFVFDKGVYKGHGLGTTRPGTEEHDQWVWTIQEEAEKFIGRDGETMVDFLATLL